MRRSDGFTEDSDRRLHQYEFRRGDWQQMVREAGFEILDSQPHGVRAGLGDLTLLAGNHRARERHRRVGLGLRTRSVA